ncbi:MAG: AAA family ATPase [Acidimicrobiaceae bacterium]|nr:AAA family ATPase [Acidimicrobiaceae bacterium]
MSADDLIADAVKLGSGARFMRCALQVNPHHYRGTFRGDEEDGSATDYTRAIVDKAQAVGVSVLAITDHNSVRDVSRFRTAVQGTAITILPGFELESTDGIQVLCVYSPDMADQQLERLLGELGVRDTQPSSTQCAYDFVTVLAKVREQGGLAIAAHSTGTKGLFKALSGQARIRAWQCPDLFAVQIPGSVSQLPEDIRQILEDRNSDYKRSFPASDRQAVAAVNAKDVTKPDDLDHDSATCWIKMSEQVTVEGLRQAFLDPDSRIRLNSDPAPEEHTELVALAWEGGGFLDGAAIHLNQNLNVMIGGRGTGKSTVVESIRYVLGLEPKGAEALKTHHEIVRHVIRPGTKLSLQVRCCWPAELEYKIERTVPNPPVVRDQDGRVLELLPRDILPRIEVYGQHEISELTSSEEKLTSLLHRFVSPNESLSQRKAEVRRELKKTRLAILQATSELDDIDERLADLPRLEQTLERFQDAGLEDRLRDQSLLVREERILASVPERVQVFREALEAFHKELPIDTTFVSEGALEDLPGASILSGAEAALAQLSRDLEDVTQRLQAALELADERIEDVRARWSERKRQVDERYQSILRQLQKSAVDGEEFIRLRRDIESLQPLSKRRALLERLVGEHMNRRRQLLAEWEDVKAEEYRDLSRAAREVSAELKDRVHVEVYSSGNREPLVALLAKEIGGRLSETNALLEQVEDISLPALVDACRRGTDSVRKKYALPPKQAERLAGASASTLMQIEELELQSTTDLKLNTAAIGEQPDWHALGQLSKGQKATAVLLLLLLESDAPLVIDQPEDDLDNRFITEGVVPRIREEKRRRQFVFSTHNANIPVLGDAELILGLRASGEASGGRAFISPEHIGSIDSPSVRALVEEVLEGGRTAFETRRRKYGF